MFKQKRYVGNIIVLALLLNSGAVSAASKSKVSVSLPASTGHISIPSAGADGAGKAPSTPANTSARLPSVSGGHRGVLTPGARKPSRVFHGTALPLVPRRHAPVARPPVINPGKVTGIGEKQRGGRRPGSIPRHSPPSGKSTSSPSIGRSAGGGMSDFGGKMGNTSSSPSAGRRGHGGGGFAPAPVATGTNDQANGQHAGADSSPSNPGGGFVPTTDAHGKRMLGTSDGTRIPATGRHGETSTVNYDGSVTYSDGTRVEHDAGTGETRIIHPGGQVTVRHRGDGMPTGLAPGDEPNGIERPEYSESEDTFSYSDGAGIKGSRNGQRGRVQDNGDILFADGTRYAHDTNSGRTTVTHPDGSQDIYENDSGRSSRRSGHLHTGPGVDTTASDDGGTDVRDRQTGTTAHFGGDRVLDGGLATAKYDPETDTFDYGDGTHVPATDASGNRGKVGPNGYTVMYSDGTEVRHDTNSGDTQVKHPDGSTTIQHRGDGKPLDSNGDSAGSDSDTQDDNTSTTDSSDAESDDSDESSDDSSSDTSSGSDSDDGADTGDDDTADDDASSDEYRAGFEGGRSADGGPSATSVVDDRVARMKGEKRSPESPDDEQPGNGGSAPDGVSQPGPGKGQRRSPLARPSADDHQSPIGSIVLPETKTPSSVGGGDCFKPGGCDDTPTDSRVLDPFDRNPATNPGL